MPISTDPARILIIHPGPPADLCRCIPLAVSLRRAWPQAKIDWLTHDSLAPMVVAHPAIDEVIGLPDGSEGSSAGWRQWLRAAAHVRKHLRFLQDREYHLCIDAHGRAGSGRLARATRAPVRIGPGDAHMVERIGYTVRAAMHGADGRTAHRVDRLLALLEPVEVEPVRDMRLFVQKADAAWWGERRTATGLDPADGAYAVIAPGSRRPSKRWPIERWAELVGPLLYRGFGRIVMIGTAEERELLRPLREAAQEHNSDGNGPLIDLVGQTHIGQMMAVIDAAGLVLANDTAPLHVAAGLDRPCVGLFGPTDPAVTGPCSRPNSALRTFVPKPGEIINSDDPKLGDALMRVISTAAVIQKVDQVLDGAAYVRSSVDEAHRATVNEGNCA